jgi:hypothetical protein
MVKTIFKAKWTKLEPSPTHRMLETRPNEKALPATSIKTDYYIQNGDSLRWLSRNPNFTPHSGKAAMNFAAAPKFTDSEKLRTYDYVVANPPFSDKTWSTGLTPAADPHHRFKRMGFVNHERVPHHRIQGNLAR